jgi:phosphonopyruvate decarboxylase
MGASTRAVLDALGVAHLDLPGDAGGAAEAFGQAEAAHRDGWPFALLVRRAGLRAGGARGPAERSNARYPMSMADAVGAIDPHLGPHDVVVATTGYISREVFRQIDRPGAFYMQGSLGHASALALGLCLSAPGAARVVAIDGDGAALMHLGALSTIGHAAPANLVHVVLDNEGYASTGDQSGTAGTSDLARVARACGYRDAHVAFEPRGFSAALRSCFGQAGPTLAVAKINSRHADLPRVTSRYSPEENLRHVRAAVEAARRSGVLDPPARGA